MQNYSSLEETREPDEEINKVIVHMPEPSRARWNHIEDLDSFFSRMYQYHQRRGFFCMLVGETLELFKSFFILTICLYVIYGVNYPVLFKDVPPPNRPPNSNSTKVYLGDVMYSVSECVSNFTLFAWVIIVVAMFVLILKAIKTGYHLIHFWDIKQFYNIALKIADSEIDNLTWHEVQSRIITAQAEQQMCIHKKDLTELDIYHRILRQQNYLVAMVNKAHLPPKLYIPFYGEHIFWTTGLRYNLQLLFFWSPWSPFENPWQLREEYKKPALRNELANQLAKQIRLLAVINALCSPLIAIWQLLHFIFGHVAMIRKDPTILSKRKWSLHSRLFLRHFNELEHELEARLIRASRPAKKYLDAFVSPMNTIIADNVCFYATSILFILLSLALYDEDVLTVQHVITIVTALSLIAGVTWSMKPEESAPADLEDLLNKVMVHTHYITGNWKGQAHTLRVRREIENLYQYSAVQLLESIFSPIITPFVLYRQIHAKSLDFVDFFRSFTVNVVGVGDVCSFALMDIKKHGNPEWHEENLETPNNQYSQGEDGKVELSLVHFACTNPSWKPPSDLQEFVKNVQNQSSLMASLDKNGDYLLHRSLDDSLMTTRINANERARIGEIWRVGESGGTIGAPPRDDVLLGTSDIWRNRIGTSGRPEHQLHMSGTWMTEGPSLATVDSMSSSVAYLHSIHSHKTENRPHATAQETTPLLSNR